MAAWIEQRRSVGLSPREFGIFVRSEAEISRAEAALQMAQLPYERLRTTAMGLGAKATLSTMNLASPQIPMALTVPVGHVCPCGGRRDDIAIPLPRQRCTTWGIRGRYLLD